MAPLRIILIILIYLSNALSQDSFAIAAKKTLSIETDKGRFSFLYFTIDIEPKFLIDELVEVQYSVKYKEVGTDLLKEWVGKYDGHLINVEDKILATQWKGPFGGIRDIRYKFYFELVNDEESTTGKSILIHIFSTSPKEDAKYYNSYYDEPFTVFAYYYDTSNAKVGMNTFSILSTLFTAYKIAKGLDPVVGLLTTAGEYVARYAIETNLENLPVNIEIKCNKCNNEQIVEKDKLNNFNYTCNNCGNQAKVMFAN